MFPHRKGVSPGNGTSRSSLWSSPRCVELFPTVVVLVHHGSDIVGQLARVFCENQAYTSPDPACICGRWLPSFLQLPSPQIKRGHQSSQEDFDFALPATITIK